jgi:hypothetical protein
MTREATHWCSRCGKPLRDKRLSQHPRCAKPKLWLVKVGVGKNGRGRWYEGPGRFDITSTRANALKLELSAAAIIARQYNGKAVREWCGHGH